jgi:hypothetical protein
MSMWYNSIALLVISISSFAQGTKKEEVIAPDTTLSKYIPTGVRIGTDALSIARTFYDKSFSGWEVNADVDFYRYYVAIEYGQWSRTFNPDAGFYKSDGSYFRIGPDINFLLKDPDRNLLFFGLRYGHSKFSENLNVQTTDPLWGSTNESYTNSGVTAHWYELVTGIKVKMWKMIWMGYTGRFKFGLSTNEKGALIPSDVPGYGRTDKDSTWGFNYHIFVIIPFRDSSGALKQ